MNKVHMFQYSMRLSKDKLLSPRTFSLLIVVLFFFYTRLSPLREFAAMVGYNVTPWIFPFLLSNLSFQLTIAFCGAYFFSDVPYMQYKEMYQMIRCGRRKWANTEHLHTIMNLVGLDGKSRKRVSKYSMGMKQRLSIAQAIMEDHDILILDEPMNGLDKNGRDDIRALLLDLKRKGKTILMSSHNKGDIDILCDRVYEMDNGVISNIEL